MLSVSNLVAAGFLIVVFGFYFWGFPFHGFHFSDFHFYADELPSFWGLSVVDPGTGRLNWEFLYHNEGLMAVLYLLIHAVSLPTQEKLWFVNGGNIAVQALNVVLFLLVLKKLVGPSRLFPFALFYLVYPFASANRYWQACTANHLAALLFLTSLLLFLRVDYGPGRLGRNLIFWIMPSLLCLWLSIITVEFAILLSPLYVLLAVYYSNGNTFEIRGPWRSSPYPALACLFLLTSLAPVLLFSGHNLTVFSYVTRYRELASTSHVATLIVAVGAIVGNGVLVFLSVLLANTLGLLLYPLWDLGQHVVRSHWAPSTVELMGMGIATGLGIAGLRLSGQGGVRRMPRSDFRFLCLFGLAWAFLAYLPFSLSYGYPRNVGPVADRINLLAAMGVTLCVGSMLCLAQDRLRGIHQGKITTFYSGCGAVLFLLLLHLQLQKAIYVEAEGKERAVVNAVLNARAGLSPGAKEPIFLLRRDREFIPPRVQLRQALAEPSVPGRVAAVGRVLLRRYFLDPPVPTSFHLEGVYWFWSTAFRFYADLQGKPIPLVYRWEGAFHLREEADSYVLGYQPTEVWELTSDFYDFRTFPKARYELVVVKIDESSFRFGGPLRYSLRPYGL